MMNRRLLKPSQAALVAQREKLRAERLARIRKPAPVQKRKALHVCTRGALPGSCSKAALEITHTRQLFSSQSVAHTGGPSGDNKKGIECDQHKKKKVDAHAPTSLRHSAERLKRVCIRSLDMSSETRMQHETRLFNS